MSTTDNALPVVGRLFARAGRRYFSEKPGAEGEQLVTRIAATNIIGDLHRRLRTAAAERDEALARPAPGGLGTSTTSGVDLEVSGMAYAEIATKLRAAGYDHAVTLDAIDMSGLRLTCGAPAGDPSPDCDPINLCQPCRCKFARGVR